MQLQGRDLQYHSGLVAMCANRRKYFHRFLAGMLDCDVRCLRLTYLAPRGTGSHQNSLRRRVPRDASMIHGDEGMSLIVPPEKEADVHIATML